MKPLVQLELHLSSKLVSHVRVVYSVFDFLGDIGGFLDIWVIMFGVLLSFYTPSQMETSIIRNLIPVSY